MNASLLCHKLSKDKGISEEKEKIITAIKLAEDMVCNLSISLKTGNNSELSELIDAIDVISFGKDQKLTTIVKLILKDAAEKISDVRSDKIGIFKAPFPKNPGSRHLYYTLYEWEQLDLVLMSVISNSVDTSFYSSIQKPLDFYHERVRLLSESLEIVGLPVFLNFLLHKFLTGLQMDYAFSVATIHTEICMSEPIDFHNVLDILHTL